MKPPCPVCVSEVDEIHWRLITMSPAGRGGGLGYVPMDVIQLQPCGHELKLGALERYRERMEAARRCDCPPGEHHGDCPEHIAQQQS